MTDTVIVYRQDANVVGIRGYSFFVRTGVPSNSFGIDGDSYMNSATGIIYEKQGGVWVTTGGGGGGPGGFTPYEQVFSSPLTSWVVNHNLGYHPLVQVYSAGSQEIEASIVHASINQFTVSFLSAQAGFVRYQ